METAAGRAARDAELEALRYNWGDAYDVDVTAEHGWRAVRRDGQGAPLTAAHPDGLYDAIVADYSARPVPRGVTPAGDGPGT